MARRCASAAILDTLRDPKVVTMPAAAQTLWIRTVTAMQNSNISVLRFGLDIMNRTGFALFIQIAESEIETNLETIIARGLLQYDADGAIMCPMLAAQMTRSEINRLNGSKGGRPRKQPIPQGQTTLMMPIDGGKMETKITENATEQQSEPQTGSTYLLSKVKSEVSVEDAEYHETGRLVLDAVGIDPARSMMNYGLVRQWLADGADRSLILEVVSKKTKPGITTLKYFSAAISEAIAARGPKKPQYEREWKIAYDVWQVSGGFGEMPQLADFKARYAA